MRPFIFAVLMLCASIFGAIECHAKGDSSICFASSDEYMCLEADNPTELLKKLDTLSLPSGTYEVFIDKGSGLRVKLHFAGNGRIKKAKLVESTSKLPQGALEKLKGQSTKTYYRAKIVIE